MPAVPARPVAAPIPVAPEPDRPEIDVRRRPWKTYRRRLALVVAVAAVATGGYLAWPRLPELEPAAEPAAPTAVPTVADPLLVAPDRNGWIRQDGLEVRLLPGLTPTSCPGGRGVAECVRYTVEGTGVTLTITLRQDPITAEVVADRAASAAERSAGESSLAAERTDLRFGRARATEFITGLTTADESRVIAVGRGRWLVVMTVEPGGDIDAYTRYRASIHIE